MNMITRFVLLLTILASQVSVRSADVIPASRRGIWTGGVVGVPGGVEQYRPGGALARGIPNATYPSAVTIDVTQAPYNADNTGATDAAPAVQAACNAAQPGDLVYLPAGTYRFNTGIGPQGPAQHQSWMDFTIRGAGMNSTIIDSRISGNGAAISAYITGSGDSTFAFPRTPITGSPTRGATVLTLSDVSSLAGYEGYMCHIMLTNSVTAAAPILATRAYPYQRSFSARIVSIDSGASTVTISPGIPFDLPSSLDPFFSKLNRYVSRVGVEDLTVNALNSPLNASPNINFGQAQECWMYGVKSLNAANYLAGIQVTLNCTIQHCDLRTRAGGGTSGAGILVVKSTNYLITDNIIDQIFPSIEVNNGSTNGVISYNYFNNTSDGGQIGAALLSNHGAHNSFNLSEGNYGPVFQSDGYHGSESLHTVFRNVWTGYDGAGNTAGRWALRLNRFTRDFNVVANIVGSTGHGISWQYSTAGPQFQTTSSTSNDITTGFLNTLTIEAGKSFENGVPVLLQSRGTPTAFMSGWVSGNPGGGTSMDVEIFRTNGSGTYTDWDVIGVNGYLNPILYVFGAPNIGNGGFSGQASVVSPLRGVWFRAWDGTPFNRLTGEGPDPFISGLSVSGITRSGTTATATTSSPHGLVIGRTYPGYLEGADQADYNGNATITTTSASQFTYTVAGSPTTPATGTITLTFRYTVGDVIDYSAAGQSYLTGGNGILTWQAANPALNGLPTWPLPGPSQTDWMPLSQNSFQDMDADVYDTLIFLGNASPNATDDGMEIVASQSIPSGDTYPISYYESGKPAWFGTLTYPPFDPAAPSEDPTRLPAGWRYVYNNEDYLSTGSTATATTLNVGTINKVP